MVLTTAVYNGQENLCTLAPSTRLPSRVCGGRIISLSKLGRHQKPTQEDCHLLSFLYQLPGTWLAFQFKSSLPFLWFLLNQKLQESLASKSKIRTTSKGGDLKCLMMHADEHGKAHANFSVFWSILLTSKSAIIEPLTKRPAYAHTKSSNLPSTP